MKKKLFQSPLITSLYFYHSGREDGGGMASHSNHFIVPSG